MKLSFFGAFILTGMVVALGPTAMAQPGDGVGPELPKFEDMDKNSDGKIAADEFTGPERFFQRVDSDSDGSVTKAEFDAVRQGRGERGGEFDPAQFEERQLELHKAALKATDEEWAALQPLVKSVLSAQRETRGAGFMMRGGPGGGPGGPGGGPGGPGAPGGPGRGGMSSPEVDALRTALESDTTSAEDIKAKLEAVRSARTAKETKLKTSRDALREVLTARQEAQLVLMGTLD